MYKMKPKKTIIHLILHGCECGHNRIKTSEKATQESSKIFKSLVSLHINAEAMDIRGLL